MKFLKFGKVNKKFLIPVFGGIVRLIYISIIKLNPKYEIISKNPFIFNIYVSISMIFAFIPYLILKCRSKRSNNNINEFQKESKLNLELIHNNIFEENRCTKIKLIFCSGIFDFLEVLLTTLFCSNLIYNLWIFDIIFMSLFSYLILKTTLYKHQYISMVIIISLGFILNIIEYFKMDDTENKINLFEISMKFLTEICLSLSVVIL